MKEDDKPMEALWLLRALVGATANLVDDLIAKCNAADAECARLERELAAVTAERDAADAALARMEKELESALLQVLQLDSDNSALIAKLRATKEVQA
jgi:septal ring factor EnvC (AmiA/AmiB activator)